MESTMSPLLNQFLYGIYPYIALAVFFAGSLARFDTAPYTWKADSSQFLSRGALRLASNLFHIGILGILAGHFVGLLTPMTVWHALGVTPAAKQLLAIVAGGLFGLVCLAGLAMLIWRRFSVARIRATTRFMDWVVLWLLLGQLGLGLVSIPVSAGHLDGGEMVKLMTWVQHIATFQGDAADYVAHAAPVFKLHLLLGLTIFLVFPFSRLVHIWSGFGAAAYLARAYQVARSRS
jgi:nitrate reductase gamma subunit